MSINTAMDRMFTVRSPPHVGQTVLVTMNIISGACNIKGEDASWLKSVYHTALVIKLKILR